MKRTKKKAKSLEPIPRVTGTFPGGFFFGNTRRRTAKPKEKSPDVGSGISPANSDVEQTGGSVDIGSVGDHADSGGSPADSSAPRGEKFPKLKAVWRQVWRDKQLKDWDE
jgi:hypothetical protein